ncbi:hypothetical protein ACROYT_G032965 [Oculina patagonica]
MKISLTKALITFLLYIDATFPESIEITRFIPERDLNKWKKVEDSFDIPQSVCHEESSGYGDYCNTSCTIKEVAGGQGPYSCQCSDNSATTVAYLENRWRCLGNQEARTQLVFLEWIDCSSINNLSSMTGPVERSTGPIFSSTLNPTTSTLEVKSKSTTLLGTATRVSISPTQAYSEKATVSTTIGPTQAITQPSSGRRQKNEDDSSSSPLGIIAGVTVSITLVLVVIAALFIYRRRKSRKDGHKSTSGHTNKNTVTSKPKTNSAFKLEEQNGFVKNNGMEPFESIYAPNYDAPQQQVRHGTLRNQHTTSSEENSQSGGLYAVHNIPDGHTIFGPRDSQEEMSQNKGLSGIDQPVYNILEDLSVKNSKETVNNGSNAPEPVYNVLEEPYEEGSEGPAWYGSVPVEGPVYNTSEEPYAEGSEGPAWYGSVPVDGPVYNTLEEPNQYTDYPSTNEPVYNVLEVTDHGGAGEADSCGPSGVQDPVYNVLEGPDPDKSSGDGLYLNRLEARDPGSCNNIPVYAVVNKKKK